MKKMNRAKRRDERIKNQAEKAWVKETECTICGPKTQLIFLNQSVIDARV